MRISDWSSDVCSSDINRGNPLGTRPPEVGTSGRVMRERTRAPFFQRVLKLVSRGPSGGLLVDAIFAHLLDQRRALQRQKARGFRNRSEEHTSELQSLMRISYAVFCLKKKKIK